MVNSGFWKGDKMLPFIKLFNCKAGYFLYDVNKNDIVELSKLEYKFILSKMIKNQNGEHFVIDDEFERLKELKKIGFFSESRPSKIEHELSPYIKDYLTKRLQGVNLQVTQDCNFRCQYCSFSGSGYYDRTHCRQSMSVDIAKKSVDFLKKHSCEIKNIRIGFYGGEPLLNFPMIKEVVEYSRKIMPEKDISFYLTTNATLLNEAMLSFFVENNFQIAISLDGPENVHDKYRRFAINGKGTHAQVIRKLKMIFDSEPGFYKNNVRITAVVDSDQDIKSLEQYFNSDIFKYTKINFSPLDSSKSDIKRNVKQSFLNGYKDNILKSYINNYVQTEGAIQNENSLLFANSGEYDDFLKALSRKTPLVKAHHSGPCIPGHSKMLVTTNGELFTCEKASGKSETMIIGDLYRGYDYKNIYSLLNIGQITENECKNCWAIRFCNSCAVNIDNLDCLSKKLKLEECTLTVKRVESLLKNHVTITKLKEKVK